VIRRPKGDDSGYTLAELLVAMGVTTILLAAVGTVFVGSIRIVGTVRDKTSMAADARIGLEAMTRSLRVAVRPDGEAAAITSATSTAITFYSALNRSGTTNDPLPTKVEYYFSSNCLYEATTPARTLSAPAAGGPFYAWDTGRVAKCLVRTTSGPTFAYFTTPEIATAGVDNVALTVPAGGLAATDLGTVQSVQMTLTARTPGISTTGATIFDRVTLNNVITDDGS
jgi:prepilin-type N-terminal cleavage/methylation domain-containing protein